MALKVLKDNDGEVAADQVQALTAAEVEKWEGRHVSNVLMDLKPRILEACKDRELAIKLLEQPASAETDEARAAAEALNLRVVEQEEMLAAAESELEGLDTKVADLTAERDALAKRVLELENEKAPKS